MIDPVIHWVIVLCLSVMWGCAAAGKWRDRVGFSQVLHGYHLLPAAAVDKIALTLPLLEWGISTALLIPLCRGIGATSSAAFLLVYALAMAVNLVRGRAHIDCGCGLGRRQAISWPMLLRNGVLAFLSLGLLLPLTTREMQLADIPLILLITVFICLAWPLVQMINNNSKSLLYGVKS